MPDLMIGDMDFGMVIMVLTALLMPAQVILCLKTKKLWVRLLPLLISLLVIAGLCVKAAFFSSTDNWENAGYWMLAISLTPLPVASLIGLGFGVWMGRLKSKCWKDK